VGLRNVANCQNFTDDHGGCNIYSCMNIDWLHQLLNGIFKNYTWECSVGLLKDIYGLEKGLDLLDE